MIYNRIKKFHRKICLLLMSFAILNQSINGKAAFNINQADQNSGQITNLPYSNYEEVDLDSNPIFSSSDENILQIASNLRAGSSVDDDPKLLKSLLQKVDEEDFYIPSINKMAKSLVDICGKVFSNKDLLSLIAELEEAYEKYQTNRWIHSTSTSLDHSGKCDLPTPIKPGNAINSPGFVDAFPINPYNTYSGSSANIRKKAIELMLANANRKSEQDLARTSKRRQPPVFIQNVKDEDFYFSSAQLADKAHHVFDFNKINTNFLKKLRMSDEEKEKMLMSNVTAILKNHNYNNSKFILNSQEEVHAFMDKYDNIIFFDKTVGNKNFFVTGYGVLNETADRIRREGTTGLSVEEHLVIRAIADAEKTLQKERLKAIKDFYNSLPDSARISNKQIIEAKSLLQKLDVDPKLSVNKKQENLIDRYNNYKYYKTIFEDDF